VIFGINPRVMEIIDFEYTRSFDGKKGKGTFLIPSNYSVYDFDQLPLVVCTHDFLSNKSDCFDEDFVDAVNDRNWFMVSVEGYGRIENYSYYPNGTELGWMGLQHDVLDAVNYMKTNFRVNENKVYWIGMGGASAVAVAKNSDIFAAGVSWFGISNMSLWKDEIDNGNIGNASWSPLIEYEIGGNQTDYPFEYKRRSALYYPQNFKYAPLKLFHGENDTFVNYTQSQDLYNALHKYNINTSYNWTNTGHCIDCIDKNATLDWLENFTRPNFSSILNLEMKTDESKSFYWMNVGLFNYNLPGPDANDSNESWGFINASVNVSANTLKIHTQNINYTLADIDEMQINQSEIMHFNIESSITDILAGFKNSNTTFVLDINSSSINISTDGNLLPSTISVAGIWDANITGIINRPYIKSAEFNLINTLWNNSELKLNSTMNITSGKNISFFIPNNTYALGEWEIVNESGYILKNSSATGVINISVASFGQQPLILRPETELPKIKFVSPTPENNTQINTSCIYINATIIDNSNISACILWWDGTNITMDKSANNCHKNITGLKDVWEYNYTVYANDTWGNMNTSGLMNVSVNYNNPPTTPNLISPTNNYRSNKINITFRYNSTDNDTEDTIIYYIYINDSLNKSTIQNSTNVTLQEGFYNWSIMASDSIVNTTLSEIWHFTIDLTLPVLTMISPQNKSHNISSIWANITINENASWCGYELDGNGINETMNNISSQYFSSNISGLPEGSHNITFWCNDTAGNYNKSNYEYFTVDLTKPNILLHNPENNSIFNYKQNLVLNFTASDNFNVSKCRYQIDSDSIVFLDNCQNTTFNITGDGQHYATVWVNDTAGNENSSINYFMVDTGHPILTMKSPDNISYNTSWIWANISLNEPGDWCGYLLDNEGNVSMDNEVSNYFYANASGLSEGLHNITFWCNDTAGNYNQSGWEYFTIDTTKPVIYVHSPKNKTYNYTAIALNVSANENISKWWYYLNEVSKIFFLSNTTLCNDINPDLCHVVEGLNNITVWANDTTGNTNSSIVYFTYNRPPIISIISPLNNSYHKRLWIWANITVNENSTWCGYSLNISYDFYNTSRYQLLEKINETYWYKNVSVTEGYKNITFLCNDSINNKRAKRHYFTVDTIKPNITIDSPQNKSYNTSWMRANVTINENASWCGYELDGNGINETMTNISSQYFSSNISGLPEGSHNITFWCNDTAGNYNKSNYEYFAVDLTNPAISIQKPENNAFYNYNESLPLNFTASDNFNVSKCWHQIDSDSIVFLDNCQNTTFNITGDGQHYATVWANDTAGNENSSIVYFTVDTIKPNISIDSPQNKSYNISSIWANITINENASWCGYSLDGQNNINMDKTDSKHFYKNISLHDGNYNITFWCNDTAGNYNKSIYEHFSLDSNNPAINLISPKNEDTWIASNNVLFKYNVSDFSLIINCSLVINSSVYITDSSIEKNATQDFTQSLSDGYWEWKIACIDSFNHTGNSNIFALNVFADKVPPLIVIHSPNNNNIYTNKTIDLNVSSNEPISVWRYNNNSADYNTTFMPNTTIIAVEGDNTLMVWANDTAGNENSSIVYFTVDTIKPNVTIISPQNKSYNNSWIWTNITINENASWCGYELDGNGINETMNNISSQYFSSNISGLPEGSHNITFWCNDTAGNYNKSNYEYFTIDTAKPVIIVYSPKNTTTYYQTYIWVNISLDEYGSWCNYELDNSGSDIKMNKDTDKNFSAKIAGLTQETHNITFWCNDTAGNYNNTDYIYFDILTKELSIHNFTVNTTFGYINDSIIFLINFTSSSDIKNITLNITDTDNGTIGMLHKANFSSFSSPVLNETINASFIFNTTGDYYCYLNITNINGSSVFDSQIISIYSSNTTHTINLTNGSDIVEIKYRRSNLDKAVLTGLTNKTNNSIVFVVPNSSLDIEILSNDTFFGIIIPNITISEHRQISLSSKNVDNSDIFDTGNKIGGEQQYLVKDAYAIDIINYSNISSHYIAEFHYNDLNVSNPDDLVVFKSGYDFLNSQINNNWIELLGNIAEGKIWMNMSSFSLFALTENQGEEEQQNNDEEQTSSGGSSSGGGIIISPVENATQQVKHYITSNIKSNQTLFVRQGDLIIFYFMDKRYELNVSKITNACIYLKSIAKSYDICLSSEKHIDLNNDNTTDLNVFLNKIENKTGELVFVFEEMPVPINDSYNQTITNNTKNAELINNANQTKNWTYNIDTQYILDFLKKWESIMIPLFIMTILISLFNLFYSWELFNKDAKNTGIINSKSPKRSYLDKIFHEIIQNEVKRKNPISMRKDKGETIGSKLKEHISKIERIMNKL